jgi:DNA-dependent RNA polymerase auxiliary subunit epsilon
MFLQLPLSAQTSNESMTSKGHTNKNKFKQLKEELATPNSYRTASGAPGRDYYQQKVDYVMDIELDDKNKRVYGEEMITYTNNSPDELSYLWLQLDQNIRKKNSPTLLKNTEGEGAMSNINDLIKENEVNSFVSKYLKEKFDGGFNISFVKDESGNHLDYTINMTMMRIDLPKPIKTGEQLKFSIKWWYNINNHVENRARSGYEYFPKDDNRLYVIAQFFSKAGSLQ